MPQAGELAATSATGLSPLFFSVKYPAAGSRLDDEAHPRTIDTYAVGGKSRQRCSQHERKYRQRAARLAPRPGARVDDRASIIVIDDVDMMGRLVRFTKKIEH